MHVVTKRRPPQSGQSPAFEAGRTALDKSLPAAIRHALKNYRGMAFAEMSEDAKAFQQQQAACKAALQHIEALLKLAGLIEHASSTAPFDVSETESFLARAEAAVDVYESRDKTDNEGE